MYRAGGGDRGDPDGHSVGIWCCQLPLHLPFLLCQVTPISPVYQVTCYHLSLSGNTCITGVCQVTPLPSDLLFQVTHSSSELFCQVTCLSLEQLPFNNNSNDSNNNNNNEHISRAPFHVKHAQLR